MSLRTILRYRNVPHEFCCSVVVSFSGFEFEQLCFYSEVGTKNHLKCPGNAPMQFF